MLVFMFSCSKTKSVIYHNLSYRKAFEIASVKKKPLCMVIMHDTCSTAYSKYLSMLEDKEYRIGKKTIVNVIRDSSSQHENWYRQWLCSYSPIITCLFSKEGNLKAVIAGNSKYSFQCLKDAIDGNHECSDFAYKPLFPRLDTDTQINFLDKVFRCKTALDNDRNIEDDIDSILKVAQYPFNVYLKYLSEKMNDRNDGMVRYAKELLKFDKEIYFHGLYSDLFEQAEYVVDVKYMPEHRPLLYLDDHVIILKDCFLNQTKPFHVRVSNTGRTNLVIKKIDAGCSCVKPVSDSIPLIKPDTYYDVRFNFTPDVKGKIEREITILSNAQNKLEIIKIVAIVN